MLHIWDFANCSCDYFFYYLYIADICLHGSSFKIDQVVEGFPFFV